MPCPPSIPRWQLAGNLCDDEGNQRPGWGTWKEGAGPPIRAAPVPQPVPAPADNDPEKWRDYIHGA